MCPEARGSKGIRIYRCRRCPLAWELVKVVLNDVSAVDTMLFERDGKWWMLTNIDPAEVDEHCSELYVFTPRRLSAMNGERTRRTPFISIAM
jgi:hypothetical protein